MLDRLIDWAVANRLLVVLGLLGILAASAFWIPRLNLDAFPDVTNIQVTVNTERAASRRRKSSSSSPTPSRP